jgi:hypothetical protein
MERTATELRKIERSLAYETASRLIDIETFYAYSQEIDEVSDWHDLASADVDLSEAVDYLVSRNLIEFHPDYRNWVRILDEDEPAVPTPHVAKQEIIERLAEWDNRDNATKTERGK